jgi:hypothetical protein
MPLREKLYEGYGNLANAVRALLESEILEEGERGSDTFTALPPLVETAQRERENSDLEPRGLWNGYDNLKNAVGESFWTPLPLMSLAADISS